jgi:DNA-binding YbaB/EbfC family protein
MAAGQPPSMQQILEQAQRMQQQLMAAEEQLADAEVEGTAGGGLVTATVSGTGELLDLVIDPKAIDPDDTESLADLILAAVRDATNNASALAAETMGPLTEGLGGSLGGLGDSISGLDLPSLGL